MRIVIAVVCAAMLCWTMLPMFVFSIFNLGSMALLLVFTTIFLCAVFWPWVRRVFARIGKKTAGRWALRIVAVLLALGIGYAGVATGMMIAAAHTEPPEGDTLPVIVLGCQTNGYEPTPMLLARLQCAKQYLDEHPDAAAVVSGGMGDGEGVSEAESMRAWLEKSGIEGRRVLKEEKSVNTEENVRFSAQLLQEHGLGTKAVIVTDWWHELRGITWARKNGLSVGAQPCPTWPLLLPVFFVRELCGVTRLLAVGY